MMGEAIIDAAARLREQQQEQMLHSLQQCDPARFEGIVVELCVRLGLARYGKVTCRTGDGGIDGALYEDRIGLGVIYLQAKRWNKPVGRPEIQKFAGALMGKGANRGVFLTTSRFTRGAIEYSDGLQPRLSLIDGPTLVELMYEYDLGVSISRTIDIKELDLEILSGASGDLGSKGRR